MNTLLSRSLPSRGLLAVAFGMPVWLTGCLGGLPLEAGGGAELRRADQDPAPVEAAQSSDRAFARAVSRVLEELEGSADAVRLPTLQEQLRRRRLEDGQRVEISVESEEPDVTPRGEDLRRAILPGALSVSRRFLCGRCSDWHTAHASGFAIADGIVVTNHHVVESGEDGVLAVADHEGTVHPVVEVLAADAGADLAIVRLGGEGPFPEPLPIAPSIPVGGDVFVLGHPDEHFFFLSKGIVARRVQVGRLRGGERLEITADFARGSSGAPIVDRWGRVVGVVVATHSVYYDEDPDENLQMVFKYAAPSSALLRLLDA